MVAATNNKQYNPTMPGSDGVTGGPVDVDLDTPAVTQL